MKMPGLEFILELKLTSRYNIIGQINLFMIKRDNFD